MTESRVPVSAAEVYDDLGGAYEEAFGHQPSSAALDHLVEVLPPGSRVLDLGSGTGWPVAATVAAAGHEVMGYDVSETMVRLARERVPAARFDRADMRTLDFTPGAWDAVLVFFSMLQLPRPEQDAMVAKVARWLAPGGYCVLGTVPSDIDGVTAEWMGHWIQVYSYSIPVLRQRFEEAGLRIVREDLVHFEPKTPDAAPEPQVYLTARKPIDG
jgi:ubiquinone/menaquinone biosynthesis C-methylase UbiE